MAGYTAFLPPYKTPPLQPCRAGGTQCIPPYELVMWDNRCTMHRGTDFDDMRYVRDMRRATVSDMANTCEQEKVAVPA